MPSHTKSKLGLSIHKADLRRDLEDYSQAIEDVAPTVNTQTDWYVNSVTGDDVVGNGTESAPLKTLPELNQRINTQSGVSINVWLDGDFSGEDLRLEPEFLNPGEFLSVYGTATQVGSGTLTDFTGWAVNTDSNILEDTSQDFSGFVKARIRFTTGAAAGAVCFVLAANPNGGGNDTARVDQIVLLDEFASDPGTSGTVVLPSTGDDYVIEELLLVRSAYFNPAAIGQGFTPRSGRAANLHFKPGVSFQLGLSVGDKCKGAAFVILKSKIDSLANLVPFSSGSTFVALRIDKSLLAPSFSTVIFEGAVILNNSSCVSGSNVAGADIDLTGLNVFQGAGLRTLYVGSKIVNSGDTLIVDAVDGLSTVSPGAQIFIFDDTLWGKNLSGNLVQLASGSLCTVKSGKTPTTPDTVRVGTTASDWPTALAAGVDTTTGAGVVNLLP